MPLVLPNWCPINYNHIPAGGAVGAIYNTFGTPILLDPQILPLNKCVTPCVVSYFQIIPINQPAGSGHTVPANYSVPVRGSGGNPLARLYTTIEAVFVVTATTLGPPSFTFYFHDGRFSGNDLIQDWISVYSRVGLTPSPGQLIPDVGAVNLAGGADSLSYWWISPITSGLSTYAWDLTYTGPGITPVDPGQAILSLGDSLHNPQWTGPDGFPFPGSDYTQFGTIYAARFPLPAGVWQFKTL
jgi:hypothetical protein